jgi:hypothetical protein
MPPPILEIGNGVRDGLPIVDGLPNVMGLACFDFTLPDEPALLFRS